VKAFCPKCREMVIVWTVLKMDEAEQLLNEDKPVHVVHPCPVTRADFLWLVQKVEGIAKGQKA
jgi:hypothetical protein